MAFTRAAYPRARRDYRCDGCDRLIWIGRRHYLSVACTDYTNGQVSQCRYCETCARRMNRWPADDVDRN